MVGGCYAVYKEAKHHELYKMRAAFEDRHAEIEKLMKSPASEEDEVVAEIFKGELLEVEKAIAYLKEEDKNGDVIQEIEDDLNKLKEKISSVFGKK